MEKTQTVVPITLVPKYVYGLRMDVAGHIKYSFNQEIIYPVETVLVFHNFGTGKQRFLRLPENTVPTVIAINSNRRLLGVIEETTSEMGKTSIIAIYDTTSLKLRRTFELPANARSKVIKALVFVPDSRAVLVLTAPPLERMYMFFFDKTGSMVDCQIGMPGSRAYATSMASNPQDFGLVAVCGEGVMKLMSKTETGFTVSSTLRASIAIKCLAWLSMEALMLGLKRNKLALIENGEVKLTFVASEIDLIDVSKDADAEGPADQQEAVTTSALSTEAVLCMISMSKIFTYSLGTFVYVFEKISKYKYQRLAILKLIPEIYAEDMFLITHMSMNAQQDNIIVTSKHPQIYSASIQGLVVGEYAPTIRLTPLGVLIHIDEIVDMSICTWRPVVLTASKDQTVRLWNYEHQTLELVKKYQVDITVVTLNTTGEFAAVGFSDQLRIMQIYMDDLNIIKTYNFPRCSQVKYSYLGHLMASAYLNYVSISSVFNLDVLLTLKGHNGNVLSLAWSQDDKYLISGGAEGAIYQWDVETGARVQEFVQKGTEYRALHCTLRPLSVYCATGSGMFRQIANSEMIRELSTPLKTPCHSLALSRSEQVMFISTSGGHLYNVQLPFLEAGGGTFTNYRFFDSAVTRVLTTYDDLMLVAGSSKGTFAVFYMKNIQGKTCRMDRDLLHGNDVLIPRVALKEKIEQIANLELRLQQQAAEFQYQENQNEIFDSQQLADLHKGYCTALEHLKNRNNDMEQAHVDALNVITFKMNDLRMDQAKQMKNLSDQFTERMIMEYQKYISFTESSRQIREGYEEQLRQSAGFLQDTVEALELDFKKKLEEREFLIRELTEETEAIKYEYYHYCRNVAAENEANMMDTMIHYNNTIKAAQDEEVEWRGKAGVLEKKSLTMSQEADRLVEEVELLQEQHVKEQKLMAKLNREIEDLRKDVTDREFAISVKEKVIQEILHKNQELEKYKQVLSHRITDLKLQIEPRECQINEKRKQITQLEENLDNLNKSNILLESQLRNLTVKYDTSIAELKAERLDAKRSREIISSICSQIYLLAGNMGDGDALKVGVRKMFQKYACKDALRKHIASEELVKAEFDRQRGHMENTIKNIKKTMKDRLASEKSEDLLKENIALLSQIDALHKENGNIQKELLALGAHLKIPTKRSVKTQDKLSKTMEDIELRRNTFSPQLSFLGAELKTLKIQGRELREELNTLTAGLKSHKLGSIDSQDIPLIEGNQEKTENVEVNEVVDDDGPDELDDPDEPNENAN